MDTAKNKLKLNSPRIMGIINVTTDSFHDAGRHFQLADGVACAERMAAEGADILDVGGESTRPGAELVSLEEELARVIPLIQAIKHLNLPISIDTSRPKAMQAAVEAGATMINDTRALQLPGALETATNLNVPVCIMHMPNEPQDSEYLTANVEYDNVVTDVRDFLSTRVEVCLAAGIARKNIIVDPGFNFGKTAQHNVSLLHHLNSLKSLNQPILVGLSRKSLVGYLLNHPNTEDRLVGSVALAVMAALNGADIIRVHDVKPTREAIHVAMVIARNDAAALEA